MKRERCVRKKQDLNICLHGIPHKTIGASKEIRLEALNRLLKAERGLTGEGGRPGRFVFSCRLLLCQVLRGGTWENLEKPLLWS